MFGTQALVRHLSFGILALTTPVLLAGAPAAQAPDGTSRFVVTLRGVRVGTESVTVRRTGGTFKIEMTGQIGAPIDLVTSKFEMTYGADWQPQKLLIEGALRNETISIGTTFGVTTATNELVQGTRRGGITHQLMPRAVVLPPNFFGAYEALAARISSFEVGARVPAYAAPEGEISVTINRMSPRQILTPSGTFDLREFDLTLNRPGLPMSVQMLVDSNNRLARVVYRDVAFAAVREDFATVMAREVKVKNPGDENAFIPASGFSLAATVTKPASAPPRAPAVILVGGPGRQDRDELLYGIPVFGQLAGRLAEAGYFVVRFDKRGVGQSGGRPEHAGLAEYAQDVIAIVNWLRRRSDVDQNRIAVLTHAEGSAVGLTAAARERRIRALGLLSAPGLAGREVVLEQQRQALERRNEPQADREAKIALQLRVIEAVTTGRGWETLPPDVRRQADTPWFKSWLQFDPAEPMRRAGQPMLILHGALDLQMPPSNGDRLEQLSSGRRNATSAMTSRVVLPGVNHLLVSASTGDLEVYDQNSPQAVSGTAVDAIVSWLRTSLK